MTDIAQSPEAVAYQLMKDVLAMESADARLMTRGGPDRAWLLDAYAACLKVVRIEAAAKPAPLHSRGAF